MYAAVVAGGSGEEAVRGEADRAHVVTVLLLQNVQQELFINPGLLFFIFDC